LHGDDFSVGGLDECGHDLDDAAWVALRITFGHISYALRSTAFS